MYIFYVFWDSINFKDFLVRNVMLSQVLKVQNVTGKLHQFKSLVISEVG